MCGGVERHEVLGLLHGVPGVEAREQDIGVRDVELPGARRRRGSQLEAASAIGVEDGPNTLGESADGLQYWSMVPFVPTSATVC